MKTNYFNFTNIGLFLFIFLSVYLLIEDIQKSENEIKRVEYIQSKIETISTNDKLVAQLQKERGLSAIYLSNTSKIHLEKMTIQRKKTFTVLSQDNRSFTQKLIDLHTKIDNGDTDSLGVFYAYSEFINKLMLDNDSLIFSKEKEILIDNLIIYNDIQKLQEISGKLRAKVGTMIASNNFTDLSELQRERNLFYQSLEDIYNNDILTQNTYAKIISKTPCLKKTLRIISKVEKKAQELTAMEWFSISTCATDAIKTQANYVLKKAQDNTMSQVNESYYNRLESFVFWIISSFILLIYVVISFRRTKELSREQTLLKNYKFALENSALISTSDKNGFITHANKALCSSSGYMEKELVGKNHNILKSSTTPKEMYKELWETISQGNMWHGLLQNRAKDGKSFWAETFIFPIFDDDDTLSEYIAIRHNVTELIGLHKEIEETQRELIYRLGNAVEFRSKESGHHIKRVAHYSKLLAELYGLEKKECDILFSASSMHDVGKIAIPDDILLKPGKLTNNEWEVMQTHSEIGYNIFKNSTRPILQASAEIAYEHHERYDGKGYPRKIAAENISIFGRIVAIADVFDALMSDRVYKKAWDVEDVLKLFKEESGKQFDPKLIKIFLDNFDDFLEIKNRFQ